MQRHNKINHKTAHTQPYHFCQKVSSSCGVSRKKICPSTASVKFSGFREWIEVWLVVNYRWRGPMPSTPPTGAPLKVHFPKPFPSTVWTPHLHQVSSQPSHPIHHITSQFFLLTCSWKEQVGWRTWLPYYEEFQHFLVSLYTTTEGIASFVTSGHIIWFETISYYKTHCAIYWNLQSFLSPILSLSFLLIVVAIKRDKNCISDEGGEKFDEGEHYFKPTNPPVGTSIPSDNGNRPNFCIRHSHLLLPIYVQPWTDIW